MKNDDDFEDDQTSTRLKVHDRTRVLDSGKSVIMIAWRAGVWRRNFKVVVILAIVVGVFVLWRSYHKSEEVAGTKASDMSTSVDFSKVGRGLVYSCSDKKFYCVDKDNYYKCRTLMKEGKSDCITRGVLDTTKLCTNEINGKQPAGINCP